MRGGFGLAVVVILFVSGCTSSSQGHPKDVQATSTSTLVAPATVTDETGGIEGSILDESELPIEGAQVGLNGNKTSTSDKEGRFSFSDLEPGTYKLAVAKLGYESAGRTLVVEAGKVSHVNITLAAVEVIAPYHEVIPLEGHITAGEAFVDIVTGNFGLPGCDSCIWDVNASKGLSDVVLELKMTPTLPNPTGPTVLSFQLWNETADGGLDTNWATDSFSNGQKKVIKNPDPNKEKEPVLNLLVTCDVFYVCFDQKFTVYVSLFYNGDPEKTYTALTG